MISNQHVEQVLVDPKLNNKQVLLELAKKYINNDIKIDPMDIRFAFSLKRKINNEPMTNGKAG